MKEIFPKDMRTNEIKNEIYEVKKWEVKIKREDLKYKTKNYIYNFQWYETIRSFGKSVYAGKINIDEAEMDQSNSVKNLVEFNNKFRWRTTESKKKKKKRKKRGTYESPYSLYQGQESIFNAFKSEIFPIKTTKGEGLKLLTPKQMLQRLPIAPEQVMQVTNLKIYYK